jgi:hypothetical protein
VLPSAGTVAREISDSRKPSSGGGYFQFYHSRFTGLEDIDSAAEVSKATCKSPKTAICHPPINAAPDAKRMAFSARHMYV